MRISKKPVEQVFEIETENFGSASISIRQARVGDDLKRKKLVAESSLVINDKMLAQEIKQTINPEEIKRYDIFLTLTACSIEEEDEEGNPIGPFFKFPLGETQFYVAYNCLPAEVRDAIYECVLEVNPQWSNNADVEGE